MLPINPVAGFWSSKEALRAAAVASIELRFWFVRPANLPDEAEDWNRDVSWLKCRSNAFVGQGGSMY